MLRWSPVYVPEIETRRHVKNNACAVEIKIKWMIRKHMTYENTYRDDTSTTPGPSAGFWKGGCGGGSCRGLWIIDPRGGSRISGHRVYWKNFTKILGYFVWKIKILCKKSYFSNFRGGGGGGWVPGAPPFHLITDKGNNSYEIIKLEWNNADGWKYYSCCVKSTKSHLQ